MKKIICYLLALCMAFCCVLALVACGGDETPDSSSLEASSEVSAGYVLPEGYQLYENGYVSFAYPSDWTVTDGSTVILQNTENTNNITVVYENATDMYENMTTESFVADLQPTLEAMGMTVSGVKVTQKENGGLAVTEMTYTIAFNGVSMGQTVYAVTVSDRTYSVTVTEVVPDSALVTNVYDSLKGLK